MNTTFLEIWQYASDYLSKGISIIPVRDKVEQYNGRTYHLKSAYPWGKWKDELPTPEYLYKELFEKRKTTGFAIVAGKVSGNLEVIDIDVKNWPGIDALLFQQLQTLYPELFLSLRIHQTPSKGYHLLYRIKDHEPEGNQKLAWQEGVKEAALETRGEGGYIVASPAMNYIVKNDVEIPVITWEERCSIINICKGFNQKQQKKIVEITHQNKSDYYDENPFAHYNRVDEGKVLEDNGWQVYANTNSHIHYTRPGKKDGISASYIKEYGIYYFFTSSTDFEANRGYTPSSALSILQHNNDKKKTFSYLVEKKYGKISEKHEQRIVKTNAKSNKKLPTNISENAKKQFEEELKEYKELHPYGVFWIKHPEEEYYLISRESFVNVANGLGFRNYRNEIVRIVGNFIYKITTRNFQDELKGYIKEEDAVEYESIANAYEKFMESHGRYTMTRLELLNESLLVSDTKTSSYKFFLNGILHITTNGYQLYSYEHLKDRLVWADKIQKRSYASCGNGRYNDFIKLAIGNDSTNHVMKCLGYLCHEYKDETTGYIIVLTEQCPDPKQGGGSGKNVFCNLLKLSTTYTNKPGAQAKFDEKFFQSWNGQRIFGISDVSKDFDFSFLKEPSTGSFIWKRLFKDEIEIPNNEAPKFIVQTNFSYDITDGGLKRRIIPIEFTDFFTRCGGLDVYFGCHFPDGWSEQDFNGYDTFIANSIVEWLKAGNKLQSPLLTSGGWEKQFKQRFGELIHGFISEYWPIWTASTTVTNSDFNQHLASFMVDNNSNKNYTPSIIKINQALREWGEKRNYEVWFDKTERINGFTNKVRKFMEKAPF